MLHVAA
jgi:hypothetical protein